MITLKFQKDLKATNWAYTSSFLSSSSHIIGEGDSLRFRNHKLSEQPLKDIIEFAEFIGKFKDFTLIAHTDCSNSINAKKLIEIADEVYIDGQPIKVGKTTDTKETKMSNELRIPEDQMQRLEAIAANIQKSVGPKTLKQRVVGAAFGRVAILMMVSAYFYLGGSENPSVINHDRANGVISVKQGQDIQNLIWNGEQLSQNGRILESEFSKKIQRSLLLGLEIVGLEDDSSWF